MFALEYGELLSERQNFTGLGATTVGEKQSIHGLNHDDNNDGLNFMCSVDKC